MLIGTRVTQLAAEFFERTKWEGVRLHQSLRKVEEEIGRKYKDILAQQRAELELEAHKMMLAREQVSRSPRLMFKGIFLCAVYFFFHVE